MAKNEQLREVNQPVWFDGKHINEALFCDDFLGRHKIIYTNGAFFTPDGRVTDELPLYKERHLVECFFQKIKWFRRIATRYDKLDTSFLAFVYLASIFILLI